MKALPPLLIALGWILTGVAILRFRKEIIDWRDSAGYVRSRRGEWVVLSIVSYSAIVIGLGLTFLILNGVYEFVD